MTHWIFSNFLWQGEKQSGAKSDHHHQAIYQDDSFPWLRFQNRSLIQKKWFSNFDRNWFFEIWNFFSKPITFFHVHAKMAWLRFFLCSFWSNSFLSSCMCPGRERTYGWAGTKLLATSPTTRPWLLGHERLKLQNRTPPKNISYNLERRAMRQLYTSFSSLLKKRIHHSMTAMMTD